MYFTLKMYHCSLFNVVCVVRESQQGAGLDNKFKSYPQLENLLYPTENIGISGRLTE